ncbi:MAG TPA: 50S ribosomal protein L23 [Synechococcales cyanobacterium M55_K2018_004]|nr:50S ribosomal protein L23 [Synechococcales cyanobacterium M55_K2018_004]
MSKIDERSLPDLIHRPLITEKAIRLLEENQYMFDVSPKATKPEIKAAIEQLFDVTVVSVNTATPPVKKKRVGRFMGHKPHYKRAIVKLAPGDQIVLFPDV